MLGATLSAVACLGAPAQAAPMVAPPMAIGAASGPPPGFVEFCRRQPVDCGASAQEIAAMSAGVPTTASNTAASDLTFDWSSVFAAAQARRDLAAARAAGVTPASSSDEFAPVAAVLPMTRDLWTSLNAANSSVNRAIASRSDEMIYGVADVWTTPLEFGLRFGDCEDFVLEKRRALLAAGLPASALSIAVVITPRAQTHAVLLVNTDHGEYVLDNLTPWVLPWTETSYEWRERQVAGSASQWAMAAAAPPSQPPAARPWLLLASLR